MLFNELFTPTAIAANWTEAASNRIPYLGEGLFPAKKQAGLDLKWIKGVKGVPISLMPSAFDAKATFRDRIGMAQSMIVSFTKVLISAPVKLAVLTAS